MKSAVGFACLVAVVLVVGLSAGCRGKPGSGNPAERERRAVRLVDAVTGGRYADARADFNMLMSVSLSAGRLEEVWQGILQQTGAFTNRLSTNATREAGYEVVWLGMGFERGALRAKVVFDSGDQVTGLFFLPWQGAAQPAKYVDESGFTETAIRFGAEGWKLDGTLTSPNGVTNAPVIVLVHGSGPHDRDETIGPNKPFRDLAWGLAGQGIAVFRYDKRTHAHQAKMAQLRTLTVEEETVADAVMAVAAVAGRAGIDRSSVYVLGHSLGGHLIPRIAARADPLAGVIIMAGNVRSLPELMVEQADYLTANGGDGQKLKGLKLAAERVQALTPQDSRSREVVMGAPMSYWYDLRDYDPVETLQGFPGRILLLQGARDYQVTMKDLELWKRGLAESTNVTTHIFPALNHLMMPGKGRSTPFEYQQPGHVGDRVIETVAAWIKD